MNYRRYTAAATKEGFYAIRSLSHTGIGVPGGFLSKIMFRFFNNSPICERPEEKCSGIISPDERCEFIGTD